MKKMLLLLLSCTAVLLSTGFIIPSTHLYENRNDRLAVRKQTVKTQQNQLFLSFKELSNPLHIIGDDIKVTKFSNTLKISASGLTQFEGNNVSFVLNLTLPDFNFNNNEEKIYKNEQNQFFDAREDAVLTLSLGKTTFGTIYRSKEKQNILSKISTTLYKITCKNLEVGKNSFSIRISVDPGSLLQESSETLAKAEEKVLTFSQSQGESNFTVRNPQPFLPKTAPLKFESSSEVWRKK